MNRDRTISVSRCFISLAKAAELTGTHQSLPKYLSGWQNPGPILARAFGDGLVPMILRAAFWITVVAVFIPQEPDVGYGHPSAPSVVPPKIVEIIAPWLKVPPCAEPGHCVAGLSFASDYRQAVHDRLERAKAELNASTPPSLSRRSPPL